MSVTLVEVMAAARCRRAALAAEVAGYIVLLAADQIAAAPRLVSAADIIVTEDGFVRLVGGHATEARAAEAALRELLDDLLLVASSGSAALFRAARRDAVGGAERLVAELEVALIPANRAAARRALARLARETIRARTRPSLLPGDGRMLEPVPVPPEPGPSAPARPELLPPVELVTYVAHSPTPVVVTPDATHDTPAPVTPVLTAPLVTEKAPLERTQPLVLAVRAEPAPLDQEWVVDACDEPLEVEACEAPVEVREQPVQPPEEPVQLLEEPVVVCEETVLAEPMQLLEVPVELCEESALDESVLVLEVPVEVCEEQLLEVPIAVVCEVTASVAPEASSEKTAQVSAWPLECEPGTRPEPVILRRATGEPAPSPFWPVADAVAADSSQVDLTDPMPAVLLPTPSPLGMNELSGSLFDPTPSPIACATPSPSAIEFLLVGVKAPPESVAPVSPRFQRSEVADLLERFRVTEEQPATDICRDLKTFAGVDGTNAPPSVTPPPIEASTLEAIGEAEAERAAPSSRQHKGLLGAAGLALLIFAGVGAGVHEPPQPGLAAAAEPCRAAVVVDDAPPGARVVVRPAASDSELVRRVGVGPTAKFERLPCGEALEVVVEDVQAGERRWRRIPIAASELTPARGSAHISHEVSASGPLAAR